MDPGDEYPSNIGDTVRARRLTYLRDSRISQLVTSLDEVARNGVEGIVVEAGCALGGSLIVLLAYSGERRVQEYDTFAMIPPPTDQDPPEVHDRYAVIAAGLSEGIAGDPYYGYRTDLLDYVRKQVADTLGTSALTRVTFFKGLLQDTMRITQPVALAHVDVDWYEPVRFSLEQIWPHLSVGGILILDDYYDWGGCRKAADEFFEGRSDYSFDSSAGNLKVVKTG